MTPNCTLCVYFAARLRPAGVDWCAKHAMRPDLARGDDASCGETGRNFVARSGE